MSTATPFGVGLIWILMKNDLWSLARINEIVDFEEELAGANN